MHVGDEQHVGAVSVELEPFGDVLSQHRRREWPKRFAEFDFQVHHRLHLWRSGVSDDRPAAKRPRTELHPSLYETDNLLLRHQRRDALRQLGSMILPSPVAVRMEEA